MGAKQKEKKTWGLVETGNAFSKLGIRGTEFYIKIIRIWTVLNM